LRHQLANQSTPKVAVNTFYYRHFAMRYNDELAVQ